MTSCVKHILPVLIIVGALFSWQPGHAQDPALEAVGDKGTIDWVEQKVTATGIGAPPEKYYGKPVARPMAKRAATMDARRNLLEVVKGVHIDSTTTVNNFMVEDDTIVAKVQGIIKNSTVDDTQYMSDGTVEVTVSMPLSGQLGETLNQMASETSAPAPGPAPVQDVEDRIRRLEDRVKDLEKKLLGMDRVTYDQEQTIQLYRYFVTAWLDYTTSRPVAVQAAGYTQGEDLGGIEKKLEDQGSQLAALTARLNEMAARLSKLEKPGAKLPSATVKAAPKTGDIYSGLVIDARKMGFKPCLRPKIFGEGKQVYPGKNMDKRRAVRKGYVRYYRSVGRAQRSSRVGKLPYTIKAKGTWKGRRSLEIGSDAYSALADLANAPDNVLASGKVVIVF